MGKGRKKEPVQVLHRPDVPLLDELGFETLEFECWRCKRTDYREKMMAEAMQRNGHKLFCIGCETGMFKWKTETLDDGTKREYIQPLTRREMHNQISPEAHMLMEKQALAQTLRARAKRIREQTEQLELEYLSLMDAIPQAEADVLEAEKKVSALAHDGLADKVRAIKKLEDNVAKLVKEIEDAKKATGGEDVPANPS